MNSLKRSAAQVIPSIICCHHIVQVVCVCVVIPSEFQLLECATDLHRYLLLSDFCMNMLNNIAYSVVLLLYYYAIDHREGTISDAFVLRLSVCLSVCPSVTYIANNSRTQRPSVPKFGGKVPSLRCDSCTSFKVTRSKIKVTRPIHADTHRAVYLSNANLPHTAGSCCRGNWGNVWRISRPFPKFRINLHQTRTQYSNEGPQHCNWAQFSKIVFQQQNYPEGANLPTPSDVPELWNLSTSDHPLETATEPRMGLCLRPCVSLNFPRTFSCYCMAMGQTTVA